MKQQLRELYRKNTRDFEVWNYLWLFADDSNEIEFAHSDLTMKFNIPLSSLHRILNLYPELWNEEKTFVEYEKVAYKRFRVKFYPKGKRAKKQTTLDIHDELFIWLKTDYYPSIDYDYDEITKHKKYVKLICEKLEKAMKQRDPNVTEESLKETFKYFFKNIGDWWIQNGNITLTLINKHFTKIINQIKTSNGGKKRDSYSKAAESIDGVDFDKLAENK